MNRALLNATCFGLMLIVGPWALAGDICSRPEPVRRAIEKSLGKSCDQISASDLQEVTALNFEDRDLENFPEDTFQGLTSSDLISLLGRIPGGVALPVCDSGHRGHWPRL